MNKKYPKMLNYYQILRMPAALSLLFLATLSFAGTKNLESISISASTVSYSGCPGDTLDVVGVMVNTDCGAFYEVEWSSEQDVSVQSLWPTNSLSPSFEIRNEVTVYKLKVTENCTQTADSIEITIIPTVIAYTGGNTGLCVDDSKILGGAADAGITYSWSPASGLSDVNVANPTVTFPGNFALPHLTYTLTADNGTGCIVRESINVSFYELPATDFSADTVCSGTATTFTNQTANAASMTSWLWEFGQGTAFSTDENPTFTYAEGGEYTVDLTATSTNGCFAKATKNVIVPSTPQIMGVVKSDPTDCAADNGRIIITAQVDYISSSGIEYSIDGGTTWSFSRVFNGLGEGDYPVRVRNSEDCVAVGNTVSLSEPPAPQILSATKMNPSDCSMQDGSISISATGGTGSLQYSIDGVNWGSTSTFQNLSAGSYPVLVRNSNGTCRISDGLLVLSEPAAPLITEVVREHTSDCLAGDGKITINSTGGAMAHQYSITGGSTWFPTNEFDNLTASTYEIRVRNADGTCVVTGGGADIKDPAKPIENDVILRNPSDCGSNDGRIEIDATPGEGLPQYSIDGGATWLTNNLFINMPAGNYDIALRNADNTCLVTGSTVVLSEPQAIAADVPTSTNPTDCDTNDGTITLSVSSGGAPVYSIDGGDTWTVDGNFTGLSPQTYDLRIRNFDETCLVDLGQLTLSAPSAPTGVTFAATDPIICNGLNGVIQFTATGNYQYSVNNGVTWQINKLFTGLSKGNYELKVRNEDQTCETDLREVDLTAPPAVLIQNVVPENITDCGLSNGSISIVTDYSGTAGLEYSIDGGTTWSGDFIHQNLAAGDYQIIVRTTDATCLVTGPSVTISAPAQPTVDAVITSPVSDCGAADGTIFIIENNLFGAEYSIDNGANFYTETIFTKLDTGNYIVRVRNTDGSCESTVGGAVLTEPVAPEISLVSEGHPTACGVADGTLTITSNPTSGLEYSVDGGVIWSDQNVFTGLAQGDYEAVVRLSDGRCVTAPQSANLRAPAEIIQLTVTTVEASCGAVNGEVNITTNGATGALEYSVDSGATWSSSENFTGLSSQTYYPAVRENSTCVTLGAKVEVGVNNAPVILSTNSSNPSHCLSADGSISITADQDHAGLQFSVDGGLTWQAASVFNGLTGGSYQPMVRNTDGTCATEGNVVYLITAGTPVVTELQSENGSCGGNGTIDIIAFSPSGKTQYSTDNGSTWGNAASMNDIVPGNYLVRVRDSVSLCESFAGSLNIITSDAPEIDTVYTQNPECNVNTGRIEIILKNILPGETQYSFNGGFAWQNENVLEDLFEGTYSFAVRNMTNGVWCTTPVQSVELTKKAIPTYSISMANPSDCGVNDGRITINAAGSDPLEYSLDGNTWQADNVLMNLNAGTYMPRLRYTDGTCTVDLPIITLTAPSAPVLDSLRHTEPNCLGDGGSITVFATPGSMDLIYSVDGGTTWFSDSNFPNQQEGTYDILIANDNESCQVSGGQLILDAQNMPVLDSIQGTAPLCAASDGAIDVFASLGGEDIAVLEYSIDSGRTWQSEQRFENIVSQTYYIQIRRTDDNQCGTGAQGYFLDATESPEILLVEKYDLTDCDANDGRVEISARGRNGGANAGVEFSLNGTDWSTSAVFTDLLPGDYTPMVRFLDGTCLVSDPILSISGPTPPVRTSFSATEPGCDSANGIINVEASGASGTVQYSLNGTDWFNSGTFTNLAMNTYTVMLRYTNGTCITSDTTINLVPQNLPEIMEISTDPASACDESDGRISVTPAATGPGSPGIQYKLNDGVYQNSNVFNNLPAGNYEVSVRFADGTCEMAPEDVIVSATETVEIMGVSISNISNCNITDGQIQINASGTSALEYSIDGTNFQDAPVFENLSAGSYTPIAKLKNFNCTVFDAGVSILAPAPIFIESVSETPASDCGVDDGTITVRMRAGSEPVEFSVDNWLTTSSSNVIDNLAKGTYSVSVRKTDGTCVTPFFNNPVTVTGPDVPMLSATVTNPECFRDNGSLTANATATDNPGNLSLEYSLDGTNWTTNNVFDDLPDGQYTVYARLENSACIAQVDETLARPANCSGCETVIQVDTLQVDLGLVDNPICIPMRMADLASSVTTIDGNSLTAEGGCEPDSIYYYGYAPLAVLGGTGGPFELRGWSYNGTNHTGSFNSLDDLAAALDNWDSDYTWVNDADNFSITGGGIGNIYGNMELYSVSLDRSFTLMTNSFAEFQGFLLTVEPGTHELITTDNDNCKDTLIIIVEAAPDPCTEPIFTQSDYTIVTDNDSATFCLPIELLDFSQYNVSLDGDIYRGATRPCEMDSVWNYLYFAFPGNGTDGPYNVNWRFDGMDFTGTVQDVTELATMMNMWNPAGEWQVYPSIFSIVGKRTSGIAGDLSMTQVNTGLDATVMPNQGMVARGTEIDIIGLGQHRLTVENIADDCAETVFITLIKLPTLDTIRLTTDHATAIPTECLETDELIGNPATITVCEPAGGGVLTTDNLPCFEYTPNQGFSGIDSFCLVLCDDSSPAVCDTTYVEITVNPDLSCDVFSNASVDLEMSVCDASGQVCLPAPPSSLTDYTIFVDGDEYTNALIACDYDTSWSYNLSSLPAGAFNLTSWMVNGADHSGSFTDASELADSMSVWDTTGDWILDGFILSGGAGSSVYSDLVLSSSLGVLTIGTTQELDPQGSEVTLDLGANQIIVVSPSNCRDTLNVNVICPNILDISTDTTLQVGEDITLCLSDYSLNFNLDFINTVVNNCTNSEANFVYNDVTNCVRITGVQAGLDSACFEICLTDGTCFTWNINVEVTQDCNDFFPQDQVVVGVNCEPGDVYVCLRGFADEIRSGTYSLEIDGTPYTGDLEPCGFDSTFSINYFSLPGAGQAGPYNITSWIINDDEFTGEFPTIDALVDSMNVWDPTGNWMRSNLGTVIVGGNPRNTYSPISTEQVATGNPALLDFNTLIVPKGYGFWLSSVGSYELTFIRNTDGCTDTVRMATACVETETIEVTITEGDFGDFCLPTNELPGTFTETFNFCSDDSGVNVIFDWNAGDTCFTYEGVSLGTEQACFIVCDDFNVCDTTYYIVTVESADTTELIAVNDSVTTTKGEITVINIAANDQFGGALDTFYLLSNPGNGIAVFFSDGTLQYTPEPGYCNDTEPDVFEYVICSGNQCDTAQVEVLVRCEVLKILTGFSPNDDGINDVFTIEGAERFPSNNLKIFNRWGNRVLNEDGYQNTWRGEFESAQLPDGTYFYLFDTGEGDLHSGYLQLQR